MLYVHKESWKNPESERLLKNDRMKEPEGDVGKHVFPPSWIVSVYSVDVTEPIKIGVKRRHVKKHKVKKYTKDGGI